MAKTIADYKADYEAARAKGDAVGMKAANDGANAIRTAMGVATQDASQDIANVAASSVGGVHSVQNGTGSVVQTTNDQGLLGRGQTTVSGYLGSDGALYNKPYVNYTGTQDSGADEGLMSDTSYAKIQAYKQAWNEAYAKGDTAGMEAAHAGAEAVRAQYGYSGGENGGAYNTYVLGTAQNPTNLQKLGWTVENGYPTTSSANKTTSTVGSSGTVSGSGMGTTGSNSGTGGTVGSTNTSGVTDYSQYLEELYAAQIESNLAALEKAYETNMNTLNSAAAMLPDQYQAARNQAAGAAAVSQRSFNQYASAAGLNAGTGAQAQLANSVALQNNLNGVNSAEAQAVAELELQRANLATEYENAIVQAKADGNYQLADALYQESVRVSEAIQAQENYLAELALQQQKFALEQQEYAFQQQQYSDQAALKNAQWAFEQQQYQDQLALQQSQLAYEQQQYENSLDQYNQSMSQSTANTDYERGLELAQYLYNATGDASGFAAYGYTADQISALEQQWALKNGVYTITSSTSSTGSSYNNGSLTSAQVKELQSYYGVTADGLWGSKSKQAAGELGADEAWAAYQSNGSLDSVVNTLAQMVNAREISQSVAEQVLVELEQSGNYTAGALCNSLANKTLAQRANSALGI